MCEREAGKLRRRTFVVSLLTTIGFSLEKVQANDVTDVPFPVSIAHTFGTTIIPARPKRIVTLGWGGEDALVALGTIPIAMPRYEQFDSGILPWVEEKIGTARPVLLHQGELDFEAIALLKPDAILAIRTDIDRMTWQRLNSIAPTIAYRSGPLQADWQEITQLAGECLGKIDEARELVEQTKLELHTLYSRHPVLSGRTFVFGSYFPGTNALGVYLPSDLRVATLVELGLKTAPQIADLARSNPGKIGTSVAFERLDGIQTDLLIVWFPPGGRDEAKGRPLFRTYEPVRCGRFIGLDDPVSVWVTSNPSVLSIPYGYPEFVDQLARAATKIMGDHAHP